MKKRFFDEAIHICFQHHSTEIVINHVTPNEQFNIDAENPRLHLKKCTPSVTQKLIEAGFMLSLDNGLISVSKYL